MTTQLAASVRSRLIEAARALLIEHGLAGTTTREIARVAGVSEGTIYNHFTDKYDLVLAAVKESSRLGELVEGLPTEAGTAPVRTTLIAFVEGWLQRADESIRMFAPVIGDPELAGLHRAMERSGGDPLKSQRRIASYLAAEQSAGNIASSADAMMLARILVGTAFHQVYMRLLVGEKAAVANKTFARSLVDTLLGVAERKR